MMQDCLSVKAGKNLKRIIKENGYTQEQFARLMNYDPTTIRKWIAHGIKNVDTITEIANFFGKSVMDILK